jgi:hypothetical protein
MAAAGIKGPSRAVNPCHGIRFRESALSREGATPPSDEGGSHAETWWPRRQHPGRELRVGDAIQGIVEVLVTMASLK